MPIWQTLTNVEVEMEAVSKCVAIPKVDTCVNAEQASRESPTIHMDAKVTYHRLSQRTDICIYIYI